LLIQQLNTAIAKYIVHTIDTKGILDGVKCGCFVHALATFNRSIGAVAVLDTTPAKAPAKNVMIASVWSCWYIMNGSDSGSSKASV
jgi:hypothetical protein